MANQKTTQYPAAGPFLGSELMEVVQAGVNAKATLDAITKYSILKHAVYAPGPPGTYTDIVLPGDYDYILDVDTSAGLIELDGFIAQRAGQKIIWRCIGSGNRLDIGGNGVGSAGNRLSASGAIAFSLQPGDSKGILYSPDLTQWVQL